MAVVSTLSNHCKYMKMTKKIDFDNDVFKIILMNTTFAFDKDAHATLADVTASQLATGYGYTQDDKTLVLSSPVSEDDTNDRALAEWDDVTWTATGDDIPATGAAIVYDDTTTDDTVIGCIDFGSDYTTANGSSTQIENISFQDT